MMKHFLVRPDRLSLRRAFSLVEVVIAIGIVSFCLFALLSILIVGAQASRDSSDMVQAATMASLIVSERRAAPTNSLGTTFPLLPLTSSMTNTGIFVAADCTTNSTGQSSLPIYRLAYTVTTNANNSASLYFCLTWPAVIDPIAHPTEVRGRYELFTCIPLP